MGKTKFIWIDLYRAIAIILVVIGHLTIAEPLHKFIYSFHLLAFYFISGFLHHVDINMRFIDFFKKQVKRLYIPYAFFSLLWIIFELFYKYFLSVVVDQGQAIPIGDLPLHFLKALLTILSGNTEYFHISLGPSWFLLSLFIVRILFFAIQKLMKNKPLILGVICLLFFALGYLCNGFVYAPLYLTASLVAIAFYYIGYVSKFLVDWTNKRPLLLKLLLLAVSLGICILGSNNIEALSLSASKLPDNAILMIINAIFGIYSLLLLSLLLCQVKILIRPLCFLGENSLTIMGLHSQLRIILLFVLTSFTLARPLKNLLVCAITLLLCVPLCMIFNRFTPVLVGKSGHTKKAIK